MTVVYESHRNAFFQAASGSGTSADPFVHTAGIARVATIKPTVPALRTSYAAKMSLGGLITFSTGLVSTACRLTKLQFSILDTTTIAAAGVVNFLLFDASPASSTFTDDGSTPAALNSADLGKRFHLAGNVAQTNAGGANNEVFYSAIANDVSGLDFTTDSLGNFYLAMVAGATITLTAGVGGLRAVVSY